jgi:bifunctional non-homologous end joining protein LigD
VGTVAKKLAKSVARYVARRDFTFTPEPASGGTPNPDALQFVVQKHRAPPLHCDFRLALGGSWKSWAVPKRPSLDSHDKRMAPGYWCG